MDRKMSLEDARARLPHLVDLAERGETTVITRHGKPAARITPIEETAMAMPHPTAWEDASKAFEKAQSVYASLPVEAQRAIDALGDLTSVHEGYGEPSE